MNSTVSHVDVIDIKSMRVMQNAKMQYEETVKEANSAKITYPPT